jgi:hypothetical protein
MQTTKQCEVGSATTRLCTQEFYSHLAFTFISWKKICRTRILSNFIGSHSSLDVDIVYNFCYGVYNQCELFIYLDLIVKNREVPIERYFKR